MNIIIALFLGILQGLTEFLPVSSSGHLVLFQNIFGLSSENNILFDVILHLGTLFAVIIVYRKTILDLIKHPFSKKMRMLIVGTIPTVLIALIFKKFFVNSFSGNFLFIGFLATSVLLIFSYYCEKHSKNPETMSYKNIIVMGIFQGLAIFPGLSRSGSTTSSALFMNVSKNEALEYSFLLSIPIILASLVYELLFSSVAVSTLEILPATIGFIASLIFGIISIKFMKKLVKNNTYIYFAIYLILLSIFLILNKYCIKLF